MKIFLSWSSHASHEVACALRDWLPVVLPFTEPWVSSEDIDKGARWATEISSELSNSNIGVICVVPGNIDQPWLNFEAGAISKSLEQGRVIPFLVGVQRNEITGPLAQFQLTIFERQDVYRFVTSINTAHTDQISETQVSRNFDACWNSLEQAISSIQLNENNQAEQVASQEQGALGEKEVEILILLSQHDGQELFAQQIAHSINVNLTRTQHYIDSLLDADYIYDILNMMEATRYGIDSQGRTYLVDHNLV